VAVPKYPKNWITTRIPQEPIKHYCPECQDKLPEGVKKYKEGQK